MAKMAAVTSLCCFRVVVGTKWGSRMSTAAAMASEPTMIVRLDQDIAELSHGGRGPARRVSAVRRRAAGTGEQRGDHGAGGVDGGGPASPPPLSRHPP
ncbi:hypothetical protein GCM10009639_37720 [Kitasatospora putterlickiae]|uniref:Uncharacterized protein n=1 Tax=Kitasatospora putterlickiae TaxID=221725 RepID=A0ABN1Y5V7_9ACTN